MKITKVSICSAHKEVTVNGSKWEVNVSTFDAKVNKFHTCLEFDPGKSEENVKSGLRLSQISLSGVDLHVVNVD